MITLNNIPINITFFPDGTSQVWKIEGISENSNLIEWDFASEADIIHLAQLVELLPIDSAVLYIKYLPYARQDKEVSNEATFALTPFSKILNSLGFYAIMIDDPHSPEATKLIKKSMAFYDSDNIEYLLSTFDAPFYPDKGATAKYGPMFGTPENYADKIRNQSTGEIEGLEIHGNVEGKRILIIDDICDGGRTFVELAKKLYLSNAAEVALYVSHGIFSKGIEPLKKAGIDKIYTNRGQVIRHGDGFAYKK